MPLSHFFREPFSRVKVRHGIWIVLWAAVLPAVSAGLETRFAEEIRPLLEDYCLDCHATDTQKGELDLERFQNLAQAQADPDVWVRVIEQLDAGEMPPKKKPQPEAAERLQLRQWARSMLNDLARAQAGDPGPVMLRRLSHAEYTYTIRDLTGVELDPARQFPADGAAGEGFMNTGNALVMSPALLQKYLEAAKQVAAHAVLLPEGFRFSPSTSRRDWTDALLENIRAFYARHTRPGQGSHVNLQGIRFDTNHGGVLPLQAYLDATLTGAFREGADSLEDLARNRHLSTKYLGKLRAALLPGEPGAASALLDPLRRRWWSARSEDVPALADDIAAWQRLLWRFHPVGQIGRKGSASSWMEAAVPIVEKREFRFALPPAGPGGEVVFHLTAGDAGDGAESDHVIWEDARLEGEGLPTVPLSRAQGLEQVLDEHRRRILARTRDYLAAAVEAQAVADSSVLAARHRLEPGVLQAWLDYLGLGEPGPAVVQGHYVEKLDRGGNYDFITGWGSHETPLILANASDQQVRIPGIARPHAVVVHPSPELFTAVGWQSPVKGTVRVEAGLGDAHPECGNGVEWFLQRRNGRRTQNLWTGQFAVGGEADMPARTIVVRPGDLISLIVGPRDGNHACDLTHVRLTLSEVEGKGRVWDLARDVSGNIREGNPHGDRHGHREVWHFYKGPVAEVPRGDGSTEVVPPGSLLARWLESDDPRDKRELAEQIQALALGEPPHQPSSPEALLYRHLQALADPADLSTLLSEAPVDPRFGRHPQGLQTDPDHLVMKAPASLPFRLPAELARHRELVVSARIHPDSKEEGAVQVRIDPEAPPLTEPWPDAPFLAEDGSSARARLEASFEGFRQLFPAALCYTKIVPVDEVVTLTLFYREDHHLQRLVLDEAESRRLDRLWEELEFVSQEPLKKVVALEQIHQFATQDRPDLVPQFAALKEPVEQRAEAFRRRMKEAEPGHLRALLDFARRAYRRPLSVSEEDELLQLYRNLRGKELNHDRALRLTLARVLTSPSFLYRLEIPPQGESPAPVSDLELATRLSYFLWSSLPDAELRRVAESGTLRHPAVLREQVGRMLVDDRIRRLAVEFACQWLHIRGFDEHNEKSERHFPGFKALRGAMYEESILFFTDLFRNNGSILSILDADHAFLNEALARHYGIAGVEGDSWQRVDGVRRHGRGGILAQATTLSKQSGASRTSPILRGNWVSETLLGERLPRPPKDVPQLPDQVPSGLTERQLIERHSSDPACAKCHRRIDPYGFALEAFDAIGKRRQKDARGHNIDTRTTLVDGTRLEGIEGLRHYLAHDRREAFLRQFCRKLLGYALGRAVQLSDDPLLDRMVQHAGQEGGRFHELVRLVVESRQFQQIRGREASR